MVPAASRRSIPAALRPHEVTEVLAQQHARRGQAVGFWLALMPMIWGVWQLTSLAVTSTLNTFLLTILGAMALMFGRMWVWHGQRHERRRIRQVITRWRRLPADPRWNAAMVLLERIAMLAENNPGLQETARRTVTVLFTLYEDVVRLKATLPADRLLDGEGEPSERYYRLVAIIRQREAQIETLLGGMRDLHIELNEQLGTLLAEQPGTVHDRLQELMDRMEAEREITRAVGLRGVQVTSML
ncbi:MAG: hypothetical protein P8R54_28930 [Myxococcota bacterium]|nr:hypothetical protein [Myxococcota bacterium]